MWTERNGVDPSANGSSTSAERAVHSVQRIDVEVAACDPRLVRCHGNAKARLRQQPQAFQAAIDEAHLID